MQMHYKIIENILATRQKNLKIKSSIPMNNLKILLITEDPDDSMTKTRRQSSL